MRRGISAGALLGALAIVLIVLGPGVQCGGSSEGSRDQDRDGFPAKDDCDDLDVEIHPGAEEVCDAIDNDCDGEIDEGFDADGDGVTTCAGDCNDSNPAVSPLAREACDGIDNDCDVRIDEDFDRDGDGWAGCSGDCDDDDATIHPEARDVCEDGIDQDCSGADLSCFEADEDGDGFSPSTGDCNDASPLVHPGAVEVCDGIDNNCDEVVDPGRGEVERGEKIARIPMNAKLKKVFEEHGRDYVFIQECSDGACLIQYTSPYPLIVLLWDKDFNDRLSENDDEVLSAVALAPYTGTTSGCLGIGSSEKEVRDQFGVPDSADENGWLNYGKKDVGDGGIGFQVQEGIVRALTVWNLEFD